MKAPFLNSNKLYPLETVPSAKITNLLKFKPLYILFTLCYKSSITLDLFLLLSLSMYILCIIVAIQPTMGKFLTDSFEIKHQCPSDR